MSKPIELTTDPAARSPEYAREVARTLSECVHAMGDLRRAAAAAERLAAILDSAQQETAGLYVKDDADG